MGKAGLSEGQSIRKENNVAQIRIPARKSRESLREPVSPEARLGRPKKELRVRSCQRERRQPAEGKKPSDIQRTIIY